MTTATPSFFAERKRIVELAGKYRLPAIYPQDEFVEAGGLMSYGVNYDDLYRRAAVYVDKILKGSKPADLSVQQATKFEFIINFKAAKQIGLTILVRVLERANQIILTLRCGSAVASYCSRLRGQPQTSAIKSATRLAMISSPS
jgi:hypothetical protein